MTANYTHSDQVTPLPWQCAMGFHQWTIWGDPRNAVRHNPQDRDYHCQAQQKQCLRCKRIELREIQ